MFLMIMNSWCIIITLSLSLSKKNIYSTQIKNKRKKRNKDFNKNKLILNLGEIYEIDSFKELFLDISKN